MNDGSLVPSNQALQLINPSFIGLAYYLWSSAGDLVNAYLAKHCRGHGRWQRLGPGLGC